MTNLLNSLMQYIASFTACGGIAENVQNFTAHWLYGTTPETLANLSKQGIVHNPPGHGGGR